MRSAVSALLVAFLLFGAVMNTHVSFAEAEDPAFQRTWERTDKPVADGQLNRTWMWGPEPPTGSVWEEYAQSPDGLREVLYSDKSRMEITNPDRDDDGLWYVTNGLLVVELMTGNVQVGDAEFIESSPAQVNVAGDAEDPLTYAALGPRRSDAPLSVGTPVIQRVDGDGQVLADAHLAERGVTAAEYVGATNHSVASVFWTFMNSEGLVFQGGEFVNDKIFVDPFYATGLPITEAYWANVLIGGTPRDVLIQCFERRCLTYAPENPAGWQVEAGNVGLHYFRWRHEQPAAFDVPASQMPSFFSPPVHDRPDDVLEDLDAKPVLDWSVPRRYEAGWAAYQTSQQAYAAYAMPDAWSIDLNGCASTPPGQIDGYEFTLQAVDSDWKHTVTVSDCTASFHNMLPHQGWYQASLMLHTRTSFNARAVSMVVTRPVQIRDHVIVSMGDSLASGEGNPDNPGVFIPIFGLTLLNPLSVTKILDVGWQDRRCHRSALSGHALAAQAMEDASPYTSVTFLSVACSGATIAHVINEKYKGIESDGLEMDPQVDQVRELIGPLAKDGGRQIDALLISAGVNNLGFGAVIEACAKSVNLTTNCPHDMGLNTILATMDAEYDKLAASLSSKLPGTREVYINDYPASIFVKGGCGQLGLVGIGITASEGSLIAQYGYQLNDVIYRAAARHRIEHHWNYVTDAEGGLESRFFNYGYCDDPSWFVKWETSFATQGNQEGTAHPNAAGHEAFAQLLTNIINLEQQHRPNFRVTIVIEELKVGQFDFSSSSDPLNVAISFRQFSNEISLLTRNVDVPRTGQWIPVPAEIGTFSLDVWIPPASPRHPTELHVYLTHIPSIIHTIADGYGEGSHVLEYDVSGLSGVKYRVDARPILIFKPDLPIVPPNQPVLPTDPVEPTIPGHPAQPVDPNQPTLPVSSARMSLGRRRGVRGTGKG